jgi:uroporphyrinogen decarboxylase
MNLLFQNALKRQPQKVPPIWMMRQAGRYHGHYQALRAKHSFMELCRIPELAAEVALGPIQDFDFDVAILFSDILFPLEAMGMGLEFGDSGPKLAWQLNSETLAKLKDSAEAIDLLKFQGDAMRATRARLPTNKSLIGFVGGPWTLFSYAVQGRHEGALLETKKHLALFSAFCEKLIPLLLKNIQLQFDGGAETVMIFDTAAGEISPEIYQRDIVPQLEKMIRAFPSRVGYYSKGTQKCFFEGSAMMQLPWAGMGFDHRWSLTKEVLGWHKMGFIQGNFDQALLHMDTANFQKELRSYLAPFAKLTPDERAGWVCGLGHGVLPKTPVEHVRSFVKIVRETFA